MRALRNTSAPEDVLFFFFFTNMLRGTTFLYFTTQLVAAA